jgi:single-strand DNA-binding protein
MSDIITIRGFVASDIKSSTTTRGTSTASFRLGSTERRFDRATNTWVDGNTNWYTVQTFRHLAGHVVCSVKKGQRIIVVGRLRLRQWEHEGKFYHVAEIDAESVGHDLMWGSANFTRMSANSTPRDGGQLESAPDTQPWPVGEDPANDDGEHRDEDGAIRFRQTDDDGDALLVDAETGELFDPPSAESEPAAA